MNRRDFLQSAALLSAAGLLGTQSSFAKSNVLKKIGIQLFSLPRLPEKDFRAAI